MAERIRVGVVGCGEIAQVMHLPHLAELDDLFELRAVCDISEPVAEACARRFGGPRVFTRVDAMLSEPLDAVLVLTSGSHAPAAIAAAQGGLHVLVEKPMCVNVAEGREMVEVAEQAGVQLMVGTTRRYDPAYARLLEVLGKAGELRFIRGMTLESPVRPYLEGYPVCERIPPPKEVLAELHADDERRLVAALPDADEKTRNIYRWRLLDNLVHELNALRGALGEPRAVKHAELSGHVVNVSLDFSGVDCQLTWVDLPGIARYRQEVAFYGLDGRVTLTLGLPYVRGFPSELAIEGGRPGTADSWQTLETVSYVDAFRLELIEFAAAINEQRRPRTDGADGLYDVALCNSIARAFLTGEPVQDPSDPAASVAPVGSPATPP